MNLGKRIMAAALMVTFVMNMSNIVTFAASKKISSVSIRITSNIVVGSEIDPSAVEITAKNSRYTVDDFQFTNSGFAWGENDEPVMEIELMAEDDYIFSLKAGDVKVAGGNYVSAKTRDSSSVLVVTVKLPSLSEQTGEIANSHWTSGAIAGWNEAIGAGSYEVRLLRDNKSVGGVRLTESPTFNFSADITSVGTYSFQVRPINKVKTENKGSWVDGPTQYVDANLVEQLKAGGASWQQDQNGWWYRNLDGSFTANAWQLIGVKWYYFGGSGYMQTGWVESNGKMYYCDLTNGDMLISQTTPDGGYVGADGAKTDPATAVQQQEETEVSWEEWNKQWKDED